jgi:hypothetical protein
MNYFASQKLILCLVAEPKAKYCHYQNPSWDHILSKFSRVHFVEPPLEPPFIASVLKVLPHLIFNFNNPKLMLSVLKFIHLRHS